MYYIIYFTRRLLEKCIYIHTETDALINQAMITSTLERNTQPIEHCIK